MEAEIILSNTELPAISLGTDPLAKFREQVAAEKLGPKVAMSASAAAKLRAANEHDRAAKQANAKFAAQFARMPKDTWTLVELLKRICVTATVRSTLERMANKVIWSLRHGWVVTEPHDIAFLGTLAVDEEAMPDEKFLAHLERYAADKPVSLVVKADAPVKVVAPPSGKRCALKSKCLRAENRQCAWVTGKSKYCSKMCLGRAKAIERRTGLENDPE